MNEQQEFDTPETVECDCLSVDDGEAIIFDWGEFCEHFDCVAVRRKGTELFVLLRSTNKWTNVEAVNRKLEPVS